MSVRVAAVVAVLVLAAGAAALRLPDLGRRAMHTDEAVLAVKSGELLKTGKFIFDPEEYHGPLLHYLALPAMWLSAGRDFAATTELTFRIVPALAGVVLVLLHLGLRRGLGGPAAWCAAVCCALSPALVFYSRYYIPETLLVLCTLGTILSGRRYAQTRGALWAVATGAGLGLMYACKETCVLAFAAMGVALAVTLFWRRVEHAPPSEGATAPPPSRTGIHLALGLGAAVAIAVVLYSAFLTNLRGPWDSLVSYTVWVERGVGGSLHPLSQIPRPEPQLRGPWTSGRPGREHTQAQVVLRVSGVNDPG